jgi:hypothetical protein
MLIADFERYQWRYRHEGALCTLYLNAGQIINEILLLTTLFNFKTHVSPAIRDSQALSLVGLKKDRHQVLYILSAG